MTEREPFQTQVIRPTSAGQQVAWWPRQFSRDSRPKSGGKTKNEAVGGDGSLVLVDCDGAELARATWVRGQPQENGEQVVEVGSCDGGTGTGGS